MEDKVVNIYQSFDNIDFPNITYITVLNKKC